MNLRQHIPNMLTIANLICGSIAVIFVSQFFDETATIFLVFLAAFFDLLDGAVARALKVSGEMGKQLDSLADVVSFGLLPTVVIYKMLEIALPGNLIYLKYLAFLNVACAAIRLAKFNISTDQTHDFIGMPSPANGIFWASVLAIYTWSNLLAGVGFEHHPQPSLIFTLTMLFVTSLLMVSKVRMFSFKLKPGGYRTNTLPYLFFGVIIIIATISLFAWKNLLMAVPMCIVAYMLFSLVYHTLRRPV